MSGSEFSNTSSIRNENSMPSDSIDRQEIETMNLLTDAVTPSACACGGNKTDDKVYVIGDKLWYDFGSLTRQRSLENVYGRDIFSPVQLIQYLLGYKLGSIDFNGNLNDAESINWVLYQRGFPRYVIKPVGPFAEVVYKGLLAFFIENNGLNEKDFNYTCFDDYYLNYGGSSTAFWKNKDNSIPPAKSKQVDDKSPNKAHQTAPPSSESSTSVANELAIFLGEQPGIATYVAFAGQVIGRTRLYNGEIVEVLKPIHRGMSNWNTVSLMESADSILPKEDALDLTLKLSSRIYEETLNPGKTPSDRAKNWMGTHFVQMLPMLVKNKPFRSYIGLKSEKDLASIGIDSIDVKPSKNQRTGGEFDVEIVLYNTQNTFMGLVVLSITVDVSDDVPVTISDLKPSVRRN